jgi:DNA polymerase-3 subunit epsilon
MPLIIARPLVFFDLETTGTDIANDRIVEISLVKLFPDNHQEVNTYRVNPGIPIPAEATEVHGITNEDVANSPAFAAIAQEILDKITDSDLCGYNLIKFDFPLLRMEFYRNNIEFNVEGIHLIDPMKIFMQKEPRDLTSALQFYCNRVHQAAHAAEADTLATKDILIAQIAHYNDLPNTVAELSAFSTQGTTRFADITGKLKYNENNEVVFNFGVHRNQRVLDNRDYVNWMLTRDFPEDTKAILRRLLGINQ